MSEEQLKFLCKYVVDNGNRPFTKEEKEVLKQAIDDAQNMQQLFEVALASLEMGKNTLFY